MKAFVLFFALLFAPRFLAAQSFELSITPSVQSVKLGETATYSIVIKPLNGYDATVFLSTIASSFRGSVTYSTSTPNPPYENITLQIKPTFQDTGIRTITIIAQNGDVNDTATCSIIATSSDQWTTVNTPNQIPIAINIPRTLGKDNDGNICFVNGFENRVFVNHFRNQHWETDTIITSLEFNSNPVSFAYDKNKELWFGTSKGIARFNGKFITVYNTSNSGIGADVIRCIDIDRNGYPVCTSKDENEYNLSLGRFDGTAWKSLKIETHYKYFTYVFCIDSQNRIILPFDDGLSVIDDTTKEITASLKFPTPRTISKLTVDKDGGIWCMFSSDNPSPTKLYFGQPVVSHYDGASWKHYENPSKFRVCSFIVDDKKNIWLATQEGVHWNNGTEWLTYNYNNSPLIDPNSQFGYTIERDVIQDRHKNTWLLTKILGYVTFSIFNPYGLVGIPLAPSAVNEEIQPPISGINLSPNPTSTSITISGIDGVRSMQIVNTLGMVVGYETLGTCSIQEVDVSNLPNGMYSIQFRTETGIISKPVVVNR